MNTIDALYTIKYNPFRYGKYLSSFYANLIGVEQNILLAPLLIPLFTHPHVKKKNIIKTSSLHTILFKNKELYDLQERVDSLRELTSESIKYCLLNDWLSVELDTLSFEKLECVHKIKIAEKFAKLFSNHSVYEIYSILGVRL